MRIMSEATGTSVKRERTTEILCHTVAKGISEIVRFSIDEDFRRKSFKILKVSSTNKMETKIYEKLLASTVKSPSISHLSSSDDEQDNEIFTHHSSTGESSKMNKSTFDKRGQNQSVISGNNWLELSNQRIQKHIIMRGNGSTENQERKHQQLFPNHSQDYTSTTQRWNITRYSQ